MYVFNKVDRELLILKRIPERSGYWQPVCGGIEENESLVEAGLRELTEETGLIKNKDDVKALPFLFNYKEIRKRDNLEMDMTDRCMIIPVNKCENIRISDEHEEYKWIEISKVKEFVTWDAIVEVCEYIKAIY